jgi:hypothetical protein
VTQSSHQDWLTLLALVDFVNEQPSRQVVTELVASVLAGMKVSLQGKALTPLETLRVCFAKAGLVPSWDMLCKTLVLCNLAEIDHAAAIQQFLQQQPAAAIDSLIKALPACKHTPEEYTQIFIMLFGPACCHVRTHIVHQAFEARMQHKDKIKKHAQAVYHTHKKPSLTQILELRSTNKKNSSGGSSSRDLTSDDDADSFAHFCNALRLPSNATLLVKQAIYYLCAIGEWKGAARGLAIMREQEKEDTAADMDGFQYPIVAPDLQTLKSFLTDLHHIGPPHHALRLFREQCIPGGHTWSTILRLYLAAHCKPAIAKELWRFAVQGAGGGLCGSSETEMCTQRFVAQTPFDANTLLQQLLAEQGSH